jgi:hypothetical protein
MARISEKQEGERIQIAILTLGMTGGGFALLTVVLSFFMNPAATERIDGLKTQSAGLVKLLQSDETKRLRAQAKLNKEQENSKGLREIIYDASVKRGLEQGNVPPTKTTDMKGGLRKFEQTVSFRPAKLMNLFFLVADVKDAKKTIQVESVTVTRDRRAKDGDDDAWNSTMRFADYEKTQPGT